MFAFEDGIVLPPWQRNVRPSTTSTSISVTALFPGSGAVLVEAASKQDECLSLVVVACAGNVFFFLILDFFLKAADGTFPAAPAST